MPKKRGYIKTITLLVVFILWMWLLLGNFIPIFSPQSIELRLYDWLAANKVDSIDPPIVLVGLTNQDWQRYGSPVEDWVVAKLLKMIERSHPKLIGLNLWRQIPSGEGRKELLKVLAQYPNIIGSKGKEKDVEIVPPPPLQAPGRAGDTNFFWDGDQVIRRFMFYPPYEHFPVQFRLGQYNYIRSLPWELAIRNLREQGIEVIEPTKGNRQIRIKYPNGKTLKINPLQGWIGQFSNHSDAGGFKKLIRWPAQKYKFETISFSDILDDKVVFLKDKIVLVGNFSNIAGAIANTPYKINGDSIRGTRFPLEILAVVTSNLLSLSEQNLTRIPSAFVRWIWIAFWVGLSGAGIYLIIALQTKNLILGVVLVNSSFLLILWIIYYLAFPNFFIPSGLTALGIIINSIACLLEIQRNKVIDEQKKRLAEERKRRLEKQEYARQLEQRVQELKQQLLAQERLAFIGRICPFLRHRLLGYYDDFNFKIYSSQVHLNNLEEIISDILIELELTNYKFEDEEDIEEKKETVLNNIEEIKTLFRQEEQIVERSSELVKRFLPMLRNQIDNDSYLLPQPINLNSLLTEICRLAKFDFRSAYREIIVDLIENYDENIPSFYGIESELHFAFVNILENAYQAVYEKTKIEQNYIPTIEVITIYLENVRQIQLTVQDNGIGIPKQDEAKVFEPFFTSKRKYYQAGVGLTLSKDIITLQYQGTIHLECLDGLTRFVVTLPISLSSNIEE